MTEPHQPEQFEGRWRLGEVRVQDTYPGMSNQESAIWTRWLLLHVGELTGVSYAVQVGQGSPVPAGAPEWLARDWEYLTKLRIDAVAGWKNHLWVVEVKSRQSMSGLGQCLAYQALLIRDWSLVSPPGMLHVVSMLTPDLAPAFERNGVHVEVV